MKLKYLFPLLALCVFTAITQSRSKSIHIEHEWTTKTDHNTCESVLVDSENNRLVVSNINGKPTEMNGKGSLDLLDFNGKVIQKDWIQGLNAPKGSAILDGILYVTDIDILVAIDIRNGEVVENYKVEGAQFLNDVAAYQGTVYFSDMATGRLHQLFEGKVSTLLSDRASINGLATNAEGDLFFLDANGLFQYSEEEPTLITDEVKGGDGLVIIEKGYFITSQWKGHVFHIENGKATELLNYEEKGKQTADIGYDPNSGTLYIPTFFNNKVEAYEVSI